MINDIKLLASKSRLFVDSSQLDGHEDSQKRKFRRKRRRDVLKMGQGGTLDPLADGVLGRTFMCGVWHLTNSCAVVGVGSGTKRLGDFLDCVKVLSRRR